MDVIDNYLDAMFATYPATTKVLEAKAELRAMMEDVYNGALAAGKSHNEAIGQALSEFGQIEEVVSLLDLPSGTYRDREVPSPQDPRTTFGDGTPLPMEHLGDVPGTPDQTPDATPGRPRPPISMAHARNFADVYRQTRWLLGWAVAIFVVAPAPLVSLNTAASDPNFVISPAVATIIGFAVMLPLVAIGVGMLVWRHQKLRPFTLINEGTGQITPEVEAYAAGLRRQTERRRTPALIAAVGLWIVAVMPLIGAGVFTENMPQFEADRYIAVGVASTMVLVAAGLLVFLPANWANSVSTRLSDAGLAEARREHAGPSEDPRPTWARVLLAAYWLVIVAIYLAWSFGTGSWDRSWIIFPVAGVAFAAIAAGISAAYGQQS